MGCCRADLRAFQDMGIVLENSMSAAQFELVVQRKAAYFYNNFVLTVCLLTAVSWLTFRMDPVSATTMPTSGLRYLYMFTMPDISSKKVLSTQSFVPVSCWSEEALVCLVVSDGPVGSGERGADAAAGDRSLPAHPQRDHAADRSVPSIRSALMATT